MSTQQSPRPLGHSDLELDERQRGEERPITVEGLEPLAVPSGGEERQRETYIPDPGERPGAVKIGEK